MVLRLSIHDAEILMFDLYIIGNKFHLAQDNTETDTEFHVDVW